MKNITKEQFLKRCETIWEKKLITPESISLLSKWLDAIMRLEGGQFAYFVDFLEEEKERTHNFIGGKTLANDMVGYKLIDLAAILSHHCQNCAEDINAWHTRPGFCNCHRTES